MGIFGRIDTFITWFDGVVWGLPLIILILVTGIFLTVRLGLLQVRYLGKALKFMVKNEEEEIRLYYPLISLNHFFEADDDVDEMQTRLEQFPEEVKKKLGDICVTHKKDRFCLHIPEQGSVYVHEHTAENEFIKKLVELMMNHGIKKEDILAIFQKEAKDIRVGDMHNGEFDFWVRFPEENEDEYYYCFKDEGCHMIYHRFLPEDYADFGF
jgi:hypothetical protein